MAAAQQVLMANGGYPVATPTFANVSLLIHGDSRPFIDVSSSKRLVVNGLAKCLLTSGRIEHSTTRAYIQVPASTAFVFGTGSWSLVAKILDTVSGSTVRVFDTRSAAAASDGFVMNVQATTRYPFITINGTNYGLGTPAANLTVPLNVETEVAFSYDGTTLRCFVGGVLSWTHTVSLNMTSNNDLYIGNIPDASRVDASTSQRIRELMIVKGQAVYTSNYTPATRQSDTGTVIEQWNPASYSNVVLNCHMSGTNGGTTFTDTSSSAKTITRNGNAQTSTAQARIGSSSGLFDGTGDYLTLADSADWDFPGDYSVEMQVRTAVTTRQCLIANYQGSTAGFIMQISLTTAGRVFVNTSGDGSEIDTTTNYTPVATNTWVHLKFSRVGTLLVLFVEGEAVVVVTDTTSITSTVGLYICRLTTALTTVDFNGYMQEVRIVKGEGTPRSFVVQTAAHPDS